MKHCLVFASLISPSKMILFEKKYQTFDTVFHHQMKHLEVRQKYSAARRIFQLSSRCFIWWRNTASHVWYITWHINKLKWWDRAVLQWYGHLLLILSQRFGFGLGLGGYPYYCDSGSIANWVVWTSENSLGRKTYWIERGKSAFCVFYVYMKQRNFENPIKLQRRWPQLFKTWMVQTTG